MPSKIDQLDAVLPQTQCRLCEHPGCRPYAEAIVRGEAQINQCLPGGVPVLQALAALTDKDPAPYEAELAQKAKPPSRVVIRESECIGCTKCIQACPVDAIIGASKQMHTVVADACTGCDLCIEPCPVDCIDIIPLPLHDMQTQQAQAAQARARYTHRNARLARLSHEKRSHYEQAKHTHTEQPTLAARKAEIAAAIARTKAKRTQQEKI